MRFITAELDKGKRNEELRGLSPDDLIRARTGYNDLDDVKNSIHQEVLEKSPQRVMRPLTAEANEIKRSASQQPKKFKMLKELARLNQELRVQKPYAPSAQEKRLQEDRNWSAA